MTNKYSNNSEVRAEQAASVLAEAVYLGVDLHKATISITRIIDCTTAQPAQRFNWEQFWPFVQKQKSLAKRVYLVYETGAFGFWVCRKLKTQGIECFVIHAEKLDPHHKRVQNDRLDSWHLADKLQRYVQGNKKAMVPVYVPAEAEEQDRLESRHRRELAKVMRSFKARGRGLLLSQGIADNDCWWTDRVWTKLQPQLSAQLETALADLRALIADLKTRLKTVEKKVAATAPKEMPLGFGRLTFALLLRELCNYRRFANRRNIGGFTGLCGGVSSSGAYHRDLSINKAGNPYIRTLLIELAWRVIYWQPGYTGLKTWRRLCGSGQVHARRRKTAVVALAHQLAIDLWRWQTGRVTLEQLGLKAAQA